MKDIYLVTGNMGKLKELNLIFLNKLKSKNIDIEEIQTWEAEEVVINKAKKAFEIIQEPIIVDDASLYIECLNGFPGPFLKFFHEQLSLDGVVDLVEKYDNSNARQIVYLCYYDGVNIIIGKGESKGIIVRSRGQNGHGIDPIFEYNGKTFAEMTIEEKNTLSPRCLAAIDLKNKLATLGLI